MKMERKPMKIVALCGCVSVHHFLVFPSFTTTFVDLHCHVIRTESLINEVTVKKLTNPLECEWIGHANKNNRPAITNGREKKIRSGKWEWKSESNKYKIRSHTQ